METDQEELASIMEFVHYDESEGPKRCAVGTARGEARVGRKLNGYGSADQGDGCPVLIVCWNDDAESVFQDLGSGMGIPLLTTTIKRLEEHGQPARIGQGRRASWLLPRCAHGGATAGSTPT